MSEQTAFEREYETRWLPLLERYWREGCYLCHRDGGCMPVSVEVDGEEVLICQVCQLDREYPGFAESVLGESLRAAQDEDVAAMRRLEGEP